MVNAKGYCTVHHNNVEVLYSNLLIIPSPKLQILYEPLRITEYSIMRSVQQKLLIKYGMATSHL